LIPAGIWMFDRMRKTQRQIQLVTLRLRTVTDTDQQQLLRSKPLVTPCTMLSTSNARTVTVIAWRFA
jgi:hypothetical protein